MKIQKNRAFEIIIAILNSLHSLLAVFAALILVIFFFSFQKKDITFFDYSPFPIKITSVDTTINSTMVIQSGNELRGNSNISIVFFSKDKNLQYNIINLISWCIILGYVLLICRYLKSFFVSLKNYIIDGNQFDKNSLRYLLYVAILTFGLFLYNIIYVLLFKFMLVQTFMLNGVLMNISLSGLNYISLTVSFVVVAVWFICKISTTDENL